ncbi:MAG: CAP domain-containing protein, partial [Oscillospiraceae bacterium]|nr:CAP domain-containing protein [Oscillospiraceae bacterium]
MKRIISLLLAAFLCMGVTALADGSPEAAAPEAMEQTEAQASAEAPSALEDIASIGEAAAYQEEEEADAPAEEETSGCYGTVTVSGTYDQTQARAMLELINQLRTGEEAWVWDEEDSEQTYLTELEALSYDYALEQIAMTRAAELALSFSHTRPDGSPWYTLTCEDTQSFGENIAYGYSTAEEAFAAWQETGENYEGQGHRRNMLSGDYTAVGIACFCVDDVYYWVQVFGYASETQEDEPQETEPLDGEAQVEISVLYDSHDYTAAEVIDPTCTEDGYTTYTCSRCGDSYTGDTVAALGHDYTATVTEPTCTADGYTTYTCSRCGDSYTGDTVAALG